jgi:hypothetical protein
LPGEKVGGLILLSAKKGRRTKSFLHLKNYHFLSKQRGQAQRFNKVPLTAKELSELKVLLNQIIERGEVEALTVPK